MCIQRMESRSYVSTTSCLPLICCAEFYSFLFVDLHTYVASSAMKATNTRDFADDNILLSDHREYDAHNHLYLALYDHDAMKVSYGFH